MRDAVDLKAPRMTAENAKKVAVKVVVPESVEEANSTNGTDNSTKGEAKTEETKNDKTAPKSDALLAIGNETI